jgi:hypothetical protein
MDDGEEVLVLNAGAGFQNFREHRRVVLAQRFLETLNRVVGVSLGPRW